MTATHVDLLGIANSADTYELRDFMQRSNVPFTRTELSSDEEARQKAGVSSLDDCSLPVCILERGSRLYHPSVHDLACALDWFQGPKLPVYDLAIFGAGPAGLSAAVYATSEGLTTIVVERSAVGGQAGSTSRIENYLGFPNGIAGWDLATRARGSEMRRLRHRSSVTSPLSASRAMKRHDACAIGWRQSSRSMLLGGPTR